MLTGFIIHLIENILMTCLISMVGIVFIEEDE